MDDFAWASQQKALKAIAEDRFREQILALEVPDGKNRPACLRPMNTRATPRVKSLPRYARHLKPTGGDGGQLLRH